MCLSHLIRVGSFVWSGIEAEEEEEEEEEEEQEEEEALSRGLYGLPSLSLEYSQPRLSGKGKKPAKSLFSSGIQTVMQNANKLYKEVQEF